MTYVSDLHLLTLLSVVLLKLRQRHPHSTGHTLRHVADRASLQQQVSQTTANDSKATTSTQNAALSKDNAGVDAQEACSLDAQQSCSPDLAAAPTFSLHDFDLLVPNTKSAASRQPFAQLLAAPAHSSDAAIASTAKAPLPRKVSMTMRARTREGPALARYLSTHASSRTDRLIPVGLNRRCASTCSTYAAPSSAWPQAVDHSYAANCAHGPDQGTSQGLGSSAMPEPPVFENLVKPPRQAAGQVTPALRYNE